MKRRRSVVSVDDLKDDELSRLFFKARSLGNFDDGAVRHRGKIMMTAFFEPSTRTRLSFEMAALRLGLGITTFHAASSSMMKGETTRETIANLVAMGPDVLVIRQKEPWVREHCADNRIAFINAGDSVEEHPSQALLDCLTLLNHFQSDNLRDRRILIVGDLAHSRVAHSNIKLMARLYADITVLSPEMFRLVGTTYNVRSVSRFADCNGDYDAVMCLRIQKERMSTGCGLSDDEYFQDYGLTKERLAKLGRRCVVLHPGPMNLGVEIEESVAYGDRSLIGTQVKNGVLMRAALIDHCLS